MPWVHSELNFIMPGPKNRRYADSNAFFFVKYVTVIFVTLTNLWIGTFNMFPFDYIT